MSPLQRKLAALSRDRQFLIRGTLVIIGACIILGFVAARFSEPNLVLSEEEQDEIAVRKVIAYESQRDREELSKLLLMRGKPAPEGVAHYISFVEFFIQQNLVRRSSLSPETVARVIPALGLARLAIGENQGVLDEAQRELFDDYAAALYEEDQTRQAEAMASLAARAKAEPPVRFANEFLGYVHARRLRQPAEALPYFQREADAFERADFSRFQLLNLNLSLKDHAALRALLAGNDYRRLVSPQFAMELGIRLRDPQLILGGVIRTDLAHLASPFLPLALVAGLVWFIILAKLGGVDRLRSPRLALYSLGFLLGIASVTLTRVFIVWQDNVLGFQRSDEFLTDLLYCISGIGLREELAKILLFLPLVPFIAKRRTQIEILITAGCVGLGFATAENIDYFADPGSAFGRLVSASFLHVSWTGMLGLALCRFWHYPKRCWEEFVGTFVAVVLIHGGYDALIMVKELNQEVGIVSVVVLALTVRHYLRKVHETRSPARQVVSPLGVFVLGSALLIGVAWIFAMRFYGIDHALDSVLKFSLSSAVLAFIYINEFRNE